MGPTCSVPRLRFSIGGQLRHLGTSSMKELEITHCSIDRPCLDYLNLGGDNGGRMSDSEFWIGCFTLVFVISTIVNCATSTKREAVGCIATPTIFCFAATAYVLIFDRNPQTSIFLFMFYIISAISGAIGSIAGQYLRRTLTKNR